MVPFSFYSTIHFDGERKKKGNLFQEMEWISSLCFLIFVSCCWRCLMLCIAVNYGNSLLVLNLIVLMMRERNCGKGCKLILPLPLLYRSIHNIKIFNFFTLFCKQLLKVFIVFTIHQSNTHTTY